MSSDTFKLNEVWYYMMPFYRYIVSDICAPGTFSANCGQSAMLLTNSMSTGFRSGFVVQCAGTHSQLMHSWNVYPRTNNISSTQPTLLTKWRVEFKSMLIFKPNLHAGKLSSGLKYRQLSYTTWRQVGRTDQTLSFSSTLQMIIGQKSRKSVENSIHEAIQLITTIDES